MLLRVKLMKKQTNEYKNINRVTAHLVRETTKTNFYHNGAAIKGKYLPRTPHSLHLFIL